jgi:hypothetical protein
VQPAHHNGVELDAAFMEPCAQRERLLAACLGEIVVSNPRTRLTMPDQGYQLGQISVLRPNFFVMVTAIC